MGERRGLVLAAVALGYAALMVGLERVLVYHPGADSIHVSDDFSVHGYLGLAMLVVSLSAGYLIESRWALLLAFCIPLDRWLIASVENSPIYKYSPLDEPEVVARDWTYFAAFLAMGWFVRRHERIARRAAAA